MTEPLTTVINTAIEVITKANKFIYFDPFQIQSGEKADYIFISHEHYDHCSIADIRKIVKPETIVITVPDCQSKFSGITVKSVKLVNPGDHFKLDDLEIQVVPAYNTKGHFHMRDNNHCWK